MDPSLDHPDHSATPATIRSSLPPAPSTPTRLDEATTASPDNMAPLEPVSSERMNKQISSNSAHSSPSKRDSNISIHSLMSPTRGGHSRDSSVSDKINQFNTLAAFQITKLDRKTEDAALKRAVLGREAAEEEARRYKDEVRTLRRAVEEGKERERRVGERLETVMDNYGRAKETHAHTQALWEKEIRRTRKETFKSQSVIVKLQEELKSARAAQKSAEETLHREKERSLNREQEAFQARYNLVGLQEQVDKNRTELEQALERIKVVEQERDAFKTLAKTEEDVARIAAEGRLPLPTSSLEDEDDEFASPRKTGSRVSSVSLPDVKSSAASEAEIDELTRLWQWERQRADRANDHIEYLEAECRLHACSCMKKRPRSSMGLLSPKRQKRGEVAPLADPSDRMILSEKATIPPPHEAPAHYVPQPAKPKKIDHKQDRRATIFLPDLGTFQTVSMEEATAMGTSENQMEQHNTAGQKELDTDRAMEDAPAFVEGREMPERYTRTPSVEPPAFASVGPERASLASLLIAPQQSIASTIAVSMPTTPKDPVPPKFETNRITVAKTREGSFAQPQSRRAPLKAQDPNVEMAQDHSHFKTSFNSRPHTTSSFYQTSTTTTTVPLREEPSAPSMAKNLLALQRTPSRGRVADDGPPTWDVNNPALTPTMTREQALAKIRERRGRAKSGAAVTPHKGMMRAVDRRDMSAPAGRKGRIGS